MSAQQRPARILVVDDTPATLRLLTAYLVSDGHEVNTARDGSEAIEQLLRAAPEVVLLDLLQRQLERSRACRRIKELAQASATPVIVSVDARNLDDRSRLHQAGADDFVSKPYQRTELLLRVGSMLRHRSLSGLLRDKTVELRSAKTLLRKQAITDALTGLHNKLHFEGFLARELEKAERRSAPFSLVVLAVDGLRRFNRGHGHRAGDDLLRRIAETVRLHRPGDGFAARFGDKRFVVFLPGATASAAREVADDLRRGVRRATGQEEIRCRVSVVSYPVDAADSRGILQAVEARRLCREAAEPLPRVGTGRLSI